MLIDWFTVIAQIVNFLILVWLLKRFLYQPVLNAIDAREKRIAKELADAAATQADALQERNTYQLKNEALDRQRDTLLNQAREEAKAEKEKLLNNARQEADYLSARRQEALLIEQQSLNASLTRSTREEVFAIARKTLADLADASLEERMAEAFVRRLQALGNDEKSELKSAFKATGKPLLLRSAYELPAPQSAAIAAAIKEILGNEIQIKFDTAPNILSGIELSCNGHKVAWSIDEYLASLGKSIDTLLKAQAKTTAQSRQKPDSNE